MMASGGEVASSSESVRDLEVRVFGREAEKAGEMRENKEIRGKRIFYYNISMERECNSLIQHGTAYTLMSTMQFTSQPLSCLQLYILLRYFSFLERLSVLSDQRNFRPICQASVEQ